MNYEPIQRWANEATNTAGKFFGQGKELLHSGRDRAWSAACRADKVRRREAKRALEAMQGRWRDFIENAHDHLSHTGTGFSARMRSAERALLKVGGLFLLFKCFTHRKDPVGEVATQARAHIEERPIQSAVIALGLGYVVGKILR